MEHPATTGNRLNQSDERRLHTVMDKIGTMLPPVIWPLSGNIAKLTVGPHALISHCYTAQGARIPGLAVSRNVITSTKFIKTIINKWPGIGSWVSYLGKYWASIEQDNEGDSHTDRLCTVKSTRIAAKFLFHIDILNTCLDFYLPVQNLPPTQHYAPTHNPLWLLYLPYPSPPYLS